MFELVFLTGARAGQVVPVTKTLLAGRSPECSLEVPDPNTSRQHSRFVYDGSSVTIVDNGSSNGTFLNDVRLTAPVKLKEDDVVRLGETRIRFQHGSGSQSTPSSIFGFKEADEDLSQSIMLAVADLGKKGQNVEVLAARLNAIIEVSKSLMSVDKTALFDRILESLFKVFPQADRGFLMIGSEVDKLQPRAVRQRGKGVAEALNVSTSICRQALEKKGAILFDDSKSSDFDQGMSIVSLKIRSAMTLPLVVEDEILGLLQIDTPDRSRAFTKDDLELALAVTQFAAMALKNANLNKKNEEQATIKSNLMRFLPGPVVQQVLDGQLDLDLGGRTCHGTILFSDIIGFTRLSETMHPEAVITMMNAYFSRMVPCIQGNAGSVDKFMGDAIMAVWGVPIDKGDSALNGVTAALSMQNALIGFNSLRAEEGGPRVEMGIGLNSGMVTAGNIGFDQRIEYTVLGDTVNTAQRLEAGAGRSQILVSANTWAELKGTAVGIAMPPLRVKNKVDPVPTFSVRGLKLDGGEVVIHLPVRCGAVPAWIVRRLADGTFLLLHPADLDVCALPLHTAVSEWPDIELGTATMEAVLPGQLSDGRYLRSQIRLGAGDLAGLLGDTPVQCRLGWETMIRSVAEPG